MPPPSLEHCKPPHQLRKRQCVLGSRAEQDSLDSTPIRAANGGQFGLSLGRLLSKGGMMKPVVQLFRSLLSSGPQAARAARSES